MGTWTAAIAFVRVDAAQNPNVRVAQGEDPAESYYRAMTVAFASVRRWNPGMPLVLVTNEPPSAGHVEALERLGVTVRLVPFGHRPPQGFSHRFAASLYMLDAMAAMADWSTVFLDPDILCIRSLDRLLTRADDGLGAVPMPYPADYDVNGLTPREAGELHGLLGEPIKVADHFGGECYAISQTVAGLLLERAEVAWALSLARHQEGETRFTTEEHLLSYALRGVPMASLEGEVRRIWTAARYRTVDGAEDELSLWHMPAEKDRGFRTLHAIATDPGSWFWTVPRAEFVDQAGRMLGLHHRPAKRLLRDAAGKVLTALGR